MTLRYWIAVVVLSSTTAAGAADPTTVCHAAKLKIAGKYNFCRMKAQAKGVKKGDAPDFAKCDDKYASKWANAEQQAAEGGGSCPVSGDLGDIHGRVTTDASAVAAAIAGLPVPGCGNGIVDPGEDCDWGDLNGETCESQGFLYAGQLECVPTACAFDFGGCLSKVVFVTGVGYDGDLGGLSGADAKCVARATAAGLTGTYRAWVANDSGSPATRFTHSTVPYVLVDGTVVASDWADLTDGTLAAPINRTETGIVVSGDVWTNVLPSGVQNDPSGGASDCEGWTSTDTFPLPDAGKIGSASATNTSWTADDINGCAGSARLYCFEQ